MADLPLSDDQLAQAFLAQLQAGAIGLHPADTLPGLTCWPGSQLAALARFKGRDASHIFLFLAATVAQAEALWQPLPAGWQNALAQLWPGALTVIHSPSSEGEKLQAAASLAIRVPQLPESARWFRQVLSTQPLPSTSANATGQPPARDWPAATALFANTEGVYIPPIKPPAASQGPEAQPSTLIRIEGPNRYTLLRQGAVTAAAIDHALGC